MCLELQVVVVGILRLPHRPLLTAKSASFLNKFPNFLRVVSVLVLCIKKYFFRKSSDECAATLQGGSTKFNSSPA